ncbi:MAG TPA: M3 family peptidase, partial [Thermoanaerobaculia bacterium]|nr:M3 family peptidase [Thermoanaerobaculia bacterium]
MPTPLLSSLGLVALLATAPATPDNPLLRPWTGPYGGVPPFDQVKVEQFQPAIEAAMAEALAEIDAIANDPAPPTFENTIVAKEKTGRTLDRVMAVFGVYGSTMSTPEFQAVELEVSPKLAAFGDRIIQNEKLFARIAAVYAGRDEAALTPEQNRLVWLEYTRFVHAGAQLGAEAKERLSAINQRLATLYTQFSQNVLADETDHLLVLAEKDLAGLPDSYRAGAAVAAEASGHPGK